VGGASDGSEAGSIGRSAGCLAGNGEGVACSSLISGDLGATYPNSPTFEGNGSASGLWRTAAVEG